MATRYLLVLSLSALVVAQAQSPVIQTTFGPIEGKVLQSGAKAFLGIPFAASPPERFSAPQDPKPWTQILKTTTLRDSCLQQLVGSGKDASDFIVQVYAKDRAPESEDCLHLNLWTPPSPAPKEGYPVMFWIHGGNLQGGSAVSVQFDGDHLASTRNVIVVTVNYRINVFGFPSTPELPLGSQNPGLLDQRKALAWVQSNIAKFGGDPKRITPFGQSAGGWSVKQLLAVPPTQPFSSAIIQSQATGLGAGPAGWNALTAAFNCSAVPSPVKCMREVPAMKIKEHIVRNKLTFAPMPDDVTVARNVTAAFETGKALKVPIMIGTTAEDGTAMAVVFGNIKPSSPAFKASADSITNFSFQCPAAAISELAAGLDYTVYRYLYNASFLQYAPFEGAGAYHGIEVSPIFGTGNAAKPEVKRVANKVQTYWTEFTKNPATPLKGWPKVVWEDPEVLVIGVEKDSVAKAANLDLSCGDSVEALTKGGLS